MMRTLFTGTAYVSAVFAAGFVLGELAAVLVELPIEQQPWLASVWRKR